MGYCPEMQVILSIAVAKQGQIEIRHSAKTMTYCKCIILFYSILFYSILKQHTPIQAYTGLISH